MSVSSALSVFREAWAHTLAKMLRAKPVDELARVLDRWANVIGKRDALAERVKVRLETIPERERSADVVAAIDMLRRFATNEFTVDPNCRRCDGCESVSHHWGDDARIAVVFRCKHCDATAIGVECATCGDDVPPDYLAVPAAPGDDPICASCLDARASAPTPEEP